MFNMESRHLLNLSVQNALDYISENFSLKNYSGGACARNSLEKCAVRSPQGRYRAHIATVYYISRPPSITKSSVPPCSRFVLVCVLYAVLFFFFFWELRNQSPPSASIWLLWTFHTISLLNGYMFHACTWITTVHLHKLFSTFYRDSVLMKAFIFNDHKSWSLS